MKKNIGFMKGRFVRVPIDLTKGSLERRAEVGVIDMANYKNDLITVLFKDGAKASYAFKDLEILFPLKALLSRLHMLRRSMGQDQIETVEQIIGLVFQSNYAQALQLSNISPMVKGFCVVDCETFYKIKNIYRNHRRKYRGL